MLKRLFQYQAHNKLLPALQVSTQARSWACSVELGMQGYSSTPAGYSALCMPCLLDILLNQQRLGRQTVCLLDHGF
jgi:hypothetical protein